MNEATVPLFDQALHTANIWLRDINEELSWQERPRAYHALRAVLHALRDRLSVDQAAAFGAQLPMLVRGFYFEGWHPAGKPVRERSKIDFLMHIANAFPEEWPEVIERITRAIFQVVARHVTSGEIAKVKGTLPGEIRDLWDAPTAAR